MKDKESTVTEGQPKFPVRTIRVPEPFRVPVPLTLAPQTYPPRRTQEAHKVAAYDKLVKARLLLNNVYEREESYSDILRDTEALLKVQRQSDADCLHWLATTRWKRLQEVQFVYLSERGAPPLLLNSVNDSGTYLREQYSVFTLNNDCPEAITEELERREHELFGIPYHEIKVFWRGWTLVRSEHELRAFCTYCTAFITEDGIVSASPVHYDDPRIKITKGPK